MVLVCNHSTGLWRGEDKRIKRPKPALANSKFGATLGYMRPCLHEYGKRTLGMEGIRVCVGGGDERLQESECTDCIKLSKNKFSKNYFKTTVKNAICVQRVRDNIIIVMQGLSLQDLLESVLLPTGG